MEADLQAARTLLDELENSVALEAACDSLALKRGSMQIRACARAQAFGAADYATVKRI